MILKTRPEESYEELGVVSVTGFSPSQTAKMHNAIRAKSAPLGANAVIITDEGIYTDPWAGPVKLCFRGDDRLQEALSDHQ